MVEAKLSLPEKVDKRLGSGITDITSSIKELSLTTSKVAQLYLIKAPCTLFKPVAAFLSGKAEVIQARSFVEAELMRRETSQGKLAYNVLSNLRDKEEKGEEIPDKIEDTDNLFAIQNAASETTDEDFIKFWARLYTEEACKPNTVSKKAINLCRNLDKEIVKLLEEKIFPYCDINGYYLGNRNTNVQILSIAKDYGFLENSPYEKIPRFINCFLIYSIAQYEIFIYPGYVYGTDPLSGLNLTYSALQIKQALKFIGKADINEISKELEQYAQYWAINEKFKPFIKYPPEINRKFFIAEKGEIVYPEALAGRNKNDVVNNIISKINFQGTAKQFFYPFSKAGETDAE